VSNRRKLTREDGRRVLGRSLAAEPVLVGRLGSYEMWARGEVVFGVPAIREDYPAELKTALGRRRQATFDGRCSCGAVLRVTRQGTQMEHEPGCIASDESLDAIVARHGGRSVRLPEDAFSDPWADS
jgi:hypothetical protein